MSLAYSSGGCQALMYDCVLCGSIGSKGKVLVTYLLGMDLLSVCCTAVKLCIPLQQNGIRCCAAPRTQPYSISRSWKHLPVCLLTLTLICLSAIYCSLLSAIEAVTAVFFSGMSDRKCRLRPHPPSHICSAVFPSICGTDFRSLYKHCRNSAALSLDHFIGGCRVS